MKLVELPITINGKWSFIRSIKIAMISIVIWIIFSLFSDNHYVQHFIPILIETLPRTNGFSFVSTSKAGQRISTLDSGVINFRPSLNFHEAVKIGQEIPNCGLSHLCPPRSFPMYLSTGKDNQQFPELCIDGKLVLSKGLNNCGRGINVAVIDNVTRTVTRIINYDTYGTDSANLETMLLTLRRGEIIVMLTFDEPSTKLSTVARLLLHELGSSQAQNLQFRTSWYFVTFKGLNGYSPYEEIAFPGTSGWGKSLSLNTCLPLSFEGQMIKPDTTVIENGPRIKFCESYGQNWPLFCDNNLINDPLLTSKIYHQLPISPEILRTPIVVINRQCNNKYFPLLLETILRQPELKPSKVMVAIETNCHPSIIELIKVFSFEIFQIQMGDGSNYLNTILDHVEDYYRYAHQLILVDGSIVLAPDFLPYMGQLLPLIHYSDAKVDFISAWNENGFTNTSVDPSLVYRVDNPNHAARLAFMVKRGTRLSTINQLDGSLWSVHLLNAEGNQLTGDGLIPDQSRVLPTWPISIDGPTYETIKHSYQSYDGDQERTVSLEEEVLLADVYSILSRHNYNLKINTLVNESDKFNSLEDFKAGFSINQSKSKKVTLICQNKDDCQKYCHHFGIAHCLFQFTIPSLGNIFRFTFGLDKIMFIINARY